MARIRTIKPDFWTDGNMVKLSPFARLLYIGMWNFTLCDHGHVADDSMKLKLQVLPMDNVDIDGLLGEILDTGRVVRVADSGGRTYLLIRRFEDHQRIDPRWKTRCPACAEQDSLNPIETHASLSEPQRDSRELTQTHPRKGRDGKGKEGMGEESTPRRATQAPNTFPITEAMTTWHATNAAHINIQHETQKFLNHHKAKGSTFKDWTAAWRNWMTRAVEYNPPPRNGGKDLSNPMNW